MITDISEYHYRSWKQLTEEEDIHFSRETNEALRGVPRRRSLELFDAFADRNGVVNAKPAPYIFVWVARRLSLNPQQCIVFEDAAASIPGASGQLALAQKHVLARRIASETIWQAPLSVN